MEVQVEFKEPHKGFLITAKILKGFAYIWGFLFTIVSILSIVGIFLRDGLAQGFVSLIKYFSTLNILNYLVILILLSPAIGTYMLSIYLKSKAEETNPSH